VVLDGGYDRLDEDSGGTVHNDASLWRLREQRHPYLQFVTDSERTERRRQFKQYEGESDAFSPLIVRTAPNLRKDLAIRLAELRVQRSRMA
jgi:hypothetical protein